MPIRVTVVDAQPRDRACLAAALARADDIVVLGGAPGGREAVDLARRVRADVVVIGPHLSGPGAVETTQILTEADDAPSIVAVADDAPPLQALDTIRAGAAGLCRSEPHELADVVRVVAHGHSVLERDVLRALVDETPQLAAPEGCTPREREVLELVARGLTNSEVCATLVISDSTVRTHIRNLRRKLSARTRAELVSRVLEATGAS